MIVKSENDIVLKIEKNLYSAGCDEAGAGCGASDLLVAAVILDPKNPIVDSTVDKKTGGRL